MKNRGGVVIMVNNLLQTKPHPLSLSALRFCVTLLAIFHSPYTLPRSVSRSIFVATLTKTAGVGGILPFWHAGDAVKRSTIEEGGMGTGGRGVAPRPRGRTLTHEDQARLMSRHSRGSRYE